MKVDFPTPGTPEMPTRTAGSGRSLEGREELAGLRPVLGAARLHQRDRTAHRGAVARADTVRERVGSRHQWPSCSRSRARRSRAERAITVPGRKTAAAPISSRVVTSLGRDDAADHDHDVVAALVGQRLLQRREQGEVTGGQAADPDDVDVGVDRLLGDLLRRGEQRAHVDVEAHVGERADDDLLAAVVAVLAHLGDQDPRPPTLGLLERRGRVEHLLDEGVAGGAGLVPEHTGDRTDRRLVPAPHLLQRAGDLADRRLGAGRVHGQRQQVVALALGRPGRPGQRVEGAPVRRRRRARRGAARAWRSAGGTRRRCRPCERRAGPRRRAGRC